MKLLPTLITLIFISILVISCQKKFDGSDGTYEEFYPNGEVLKKSIEYKDGKKNGAFLEYYSNGKTKTEASFVNDLDNGVRNKYYDSGQLKSEENYAMGQREGWTKVYTKKGILQSEVLYHKDECDGPFNTYYDNGKPAKIFNFKKGLKNGEMKKYYQSGQIKSIAYYKNDHPGTGLKEYENNGTEINNDFQILSTEKNTLLIDGKYTYTFRLSSIGENDELWNIKLNEGKYLIMEGEYYLLPRSKQNTYEKIFHPLPGEMIVTQMHLAAVKKTRFDNYYIKKQTINISISTNF